MTNTKIFTSLGLEIVVTTPYSEFLKAFNNAVRDGTTLQINDSCFNPANILYIKRVEAEQ